MPIHFKVAEFDDTCLLQVLHSISFCKTIIRTRLALPRINPHSFFTEYRISIDVLLNHLVFYRGKIVNEPADIFLYM